MAISVIIVGGETLFRQGLTSLLAETPDTQVLAQAANGNWKGD